MTVLFKAKTREGYALKILIELLQNNIKTACFEVEKSGIRLRMMDNPKTILIDLELEADNFSVYRYKPEERLYLGINLAHLHKMLKPIRKKDSVKFFIDDEVPTELGIEIIPAENNRRTTSKIQIQNIQSLDIDLPDGYQKPVNVPSSEFQKMTKSLSQISNITRITASGFCIRFSSDAGGVMKRYTEFGETEDSDGEDDDSDSESAEYSEDFDTELLSRIAKIAGLGSNMQIYCKSDNPLLFRSQIGMNLGRISVYLKSKNLQETESKAVESDDE